MTRFGPASRAGAALFAVAVAGCARHETGTAPPARTAERPEHLALSLAAVGYPGAMRSFQVGPGAGVWTGETLLRWRLTGDSSAPATPVWFESDGVPIAHVGLLGA